MKSLWKYCFIILTELIYIKSNREDKEEEGKEEEKS